MTSLRKFAIKLKSLEKMNEGKERRGEVEVRNASKYVSLYIGAE
jgi:hypothetical protein